MLQPIRSLIRSRDPPVLRGMEKSLPPSSPSRQPISTDLLRQGCFNPFDDIAMETLALTAAFGFLRCAEFSTPSTSSFPALGLKRSDLRKKNKRRSSPLNHAASSSPGLDLHVQ
ncbi:UNVERIFIED_CONTAM: hypothetical protein FKN15_062437 [Acipenser sinensis]